MEKAKSLFKFAVKVWLGLIVIRGVSYVTYRFIGPELASWVDDPMGKIIGMVFPPK